MDAKLLEQITTVDGGRFTAVPELCTGMKTAPCEKCYHFHPGVNDPREGYRCATTPSCPGVTLSKGTKSYIWVKLGWMTAEERNALFGQTPRHLSDDVALAEKPDLAVVPEVAVGIAFLQGT